MHTYIHTEYIAAFFNRETEVSGLEVCTYACTYLQMYVSMHTHSYIYTFIFSIYM